MGDIEVLESKKKYTLTKRDRAFLRKLNILARIVEMKLDLTRRYTLQEIADDVGVSTKTLKRYMQGDLFETMFDAVKKERMTALRIADSVDRVMPEVVERVRNIALHGEDREALQAARLLREFWKEDSGRPEDYGAQLRPI